MRKVVVGLVALGALAAAPAVASAEHRFGTDRGSRYEGGRSSRSSFGISIGFGSSSWDRGGYSHSSFRYGYNDCGPAYPVYRAPVISCPPPVVYSAPRVVYSAPVYVAPPVVYYPPPPVYVAQPVYAAPACPPSTYYYSTGAYYYGR